MKNQLKSKQQPAPKKSRPSPVAVIISNSSDIDDITVHDMRHNNEMLRSLLDCWPLCTERPTIHVRKLFSIKNRSARLRIVLFVAAFRSSAWKRIAKDEDRHLDLLEAILAIGPTLPKAKYRRRAREAAIAAALLLHWPHRRAILNEIKAAFQHAGLAINTHKTVQQLAAGMEVKLRRLDAGFYDRRLVGPINCPYM